MLTLNDKLDEMYEQDWFLSSSKDIPVLEEKCILKFQGYRLYSGKNSHIEIFNIKNSKVIIIDSPVKSSLNLFLNTLDQEGNFSHKCEEAVKQIDGRFTILLHDQISLKVITSRFNTPLISSFSNHELDLFSNSLSVLSSTLKHLGLYLADTQLIYEFLKYKRIFGRDTHTKNVQTLPPASICEFSCNQLVSKVYYTPDYEKYAFTLSDAAEYLQYLIKSSLNELTKIHGNFGIMQSGGLDTRLLLACMPDLDVTGFTITYEKNRERIVAGQMLKHKNIQSEWIKLSKKNYTKFFDHSAVLTGALYMSDGLFYGHREALEKYSIKNIIAGYGLDYFFQGMYLPSKNFEIFGKKTWWKYPIKIDADIPNFFLENISYHAKGFNADNLFKPKALDLYKAKLTEKLRNLTLEARKFSDDPVDNFEYISLKDLGQHYTNGGQRALAQLGKLHVPAYSNALFDFYKKIPHDFRFDARVLREALKQTDPVLYKMISANHGYPAGWSSLRRALVHTSYGQVKRVFQQRSFERTWLSSEEILRAELSDKVAEIRRGRLFDIFPELDADKTIEFVDNWLNSKIIGNQTMLLLLTISSYLKHIED